MSLFGTIQQSANALQVNQLGLHVTGNNIANANTPGYIRQELLQSTVAGVRIGGVILGYGVRAAGVVQKLDNFVVERLRETSSSLASAEAQVEANSQIEAFFNELSDTGFNSRLADFSNAIQDVLNQPGNDSIRRLVIERGKTLTSELRSMRGRLDNLATAVDSEISSSVGEINRLTNRIAELNTRIVELEGGRLGTSDAVGLRDERLSVLSDLAKLIDIRAVEQESGSVTVFVGGEYLVADGIKRDVAYGLTSDGEESYPEVRLADTDSPLQISAGRLHGLYTMRRETSQRLISDLDQYANDIITQFNQIHSQGQGISGFSEVTGTFASDDPTAPLDLAGLAAEIKNGSFEVLVRDKNTGLTTTQNIRIQLTGGVNDTSLEDVKNALDAISGLSATITAEGKLRISADTTRLEFAFQNDHSNFLAAAGINTFFVGDSAANIAINDVVANDPQKFAASLSGISTDTQNALRLAAAFDEPLEGLGDRSFKQAFEDIVIRTSQDINVQAGLADGLRNFYNTLEAQHLAASGVNLDEEAVKMIFYQRAFQASSKLIQTTSEMLEVLVNL
ncbi:MAG: flagellar hook-associated protein FlgK [Planctomycetales bacterium]|nr:flagellar hook-associated protein FlgK [Planctomycetales bacterium]